MDTGIHVANLSAWFGTKQALFDIGMEIPSKKATAIIGPSGCGKSTFVRCLNRMHETLPDTRVAGKVSIGDLDVYGKGVSAVWIRRRVGMVFQKANPFPTMTIYDNVAAGLKLNGFRNRRELDNVVERSLKQAGKEDPMMMKTQEEMFDKLYLGPAFGWAAKYGFGLPLSYLVIADSFLHSGSMLDFLMNRFPEKKPAAGGDSKVWITAYTKTRKDWLTSHSNSLLRNTVYRCNCYLIQIDKNNWDLEETPVVMHGTPVNYA